MLSGPRSGFGKGWGEGEVLVTLHFSPCTSFYEDMTGQIECEDTRGRVEAPSPEVTMTVRLGRVFDIPVEIHASWIVIFLLLSYAVGMGYVAHLHPNLTTIQALGAGILGALALFTCLFMHELAHAVVARAFGLATRSITFFLLGGVARLKQEPGTWSQELAIALAGPATSFALAVFFASVWLILPPGTVWATVAFYLAFSNALLGAVNLLPGFPLDGGRVLRSVLWRALNNRLSATRVATIAGRAVGLGVVGLGAAMVLLMGDPSGIWLIVIGWFVNGAAAGSWEQERVRSSLEGAGAADLITGHPPALSPDRKLTDVFSPQAPENEEEAWPVTDQNGLIGILVPSGIAAVPTSERARKTVGEVMLPADEDHVVAAEDDAWDVIQRMSELRDGEGVVVVQGNTVSGTVTGRKLCQLLSARLQAAASESHG